MITVKELFARLSYGPLTNLAISNEGAGGIIATKQAAIIHYTNEALLRLYSKFILSEKEMIIEMQDGISSYLLTSEHAFSKTDNDAVTYIRDTVLLPYEDDLIKILAVFNSSGCRLPLNDDAACDSLFTPQFNLLQIPCVVPEATLHVIYQARHVKLSPNPINLDAIITFPEVLEEALLAYISHKVFSHMNGQEHAAKAAGHLANYEAICREVAEQDTVNSSISQTNTKFCDRGFR